MLVEELAAAMGVEVNIAPTAADNLDSAGAVEAAVGQEGAKTVGVGDGLDSVTLEDDGKEGAAAAAAAAAAVAAASFVGVVAVRAATVPLLSTVRSVGTHISGCNCGTSGSASRAFHSPHVRPAMRVMLKSDT